jgi:cobalt/nickel transport system permease protein
MHIPDGFIDAKTAVTTAALSAAGVGLALRRVRQELPPRRVPLLGLSAAFLFAAQMLNFPVAGGTSGHLLGGVLVAALLGPAAAVVVLTTVLIVQCFLFADGGVSALGANVFNMALLGTVGGWAIYRAVGRCLPDLRGQVAAVAFAGWCSTVLASLACAGQLAWSGTVAWSAAFVAMTGVHLLIGVGEGLISALVFLAIARTRPDLVSGASSSPVSGRAGGLVGFGLIVSLGLAVFVAPFACPWPDGLEAVAEKLGFARAAREPLLPSPAADYVVPGIGSPALATAVAGAAGALVVFGLALLLSRALVPASRGRADVRTNGNTDGNKPTTAAS